MLRAKVVREEVKPERAEGVKLREAKARAGEGKAKVHRVEEGVRIRQRSPLDSSKNSTKTVIKRLTRMSWLRP